MVRSLLVVCGLLYGSAALAALDMMGRHVFFLHAGVDEIKGSYMFLVNNTGAEPEDLSFKLMLPEETVDWFPHEGIGPDELRPGSDGGLVIQKLFPPGETFLSLGFSVPAEGTEAKLTFRPAFNVGSMAFFAREDGVNLGPTRDKFEQRSGVEFSGATYNTLTRGNIAAGEMVKLTFSGIPEGRKRLWGLGAVFGFLMLALGGVLTFKTSPQEPADDVV